MVRRTPPHIGFDDLLLADLVEPAITVISQDPARIGTIAAERALAQLAGDTQPFRTYVVPTRLIVRGSGEILPRFATDGRALSHRNHRRPYQRDRHVGTISAKGLENQRDGGAC
jgi:hypothetical protein